MTISHFMSLFYGASRFSFYVNDILTDLGLLYTNESKLTGFDIEDNVIRFYTY